MKFLADLRLGFKALARTMTDAVQDRTGVATIDYALIAGLVALAAVTGLQILGDVVIIMYDTISTAFVAALSP